MSRLWASEAAAGGRISISQSVMRYFLPFLLFIAWRIFVSDADKESARRKGLRGRERGKETGPSVRRGKGSPDMLMMKGVMEVGKINMLPLIHKYSYFQIIWDHLTLGEP